MKLLFKIYYRIRFGKVKWIAKDSIAGHICEYEIRDRHNCIVGYWAYGDFDPSYPYRRAV